MRQYIELLKTIKEKGTFKGEARENMPTTTSLFGYQFRHDLSEGFPLLTTKELDFKKIVVELMWFLKGETNIKYLIDRGCNIWNQDAYNYYVKLCKQSEEPNDLFIEEIEKSRLRMQTFEEFIESVKEGWFATDVKYRWGDCGKQYGWLWRRWRGEHIFGDGKVESGQGNRYVSGQVVIDQIKDLIEGLQTNPMSRRHIITAWNPATLDHMALNACHALVQFNCRPIPWEVKLEMAKRHPNVDMENLAITEAASGNPHYGPIPQYYLDCQMYQRSGDAFLGVPFNIASYSLLIEIIAKMTNMVPGELIHTFGDVHIYSNHDEQTDLQITREPTKLPKLIIDEDFDKMIEGWKVVGTYSFEELIDMIDETMFSVEGYEPDQRIKGKLSTGM